MRKTGKINLDLTAVQALFSILAISFAGLVSKASPTFDIADLYSPILPMIGSEFKMCPAPYSVDFCSKGTVTCNARSASFSLDSNLPASRKNPVCSSPARSESDKQNES